MAANCVTLGRFPITITGEDNRVQFFNFADRTDAETHGSQFHDCDYVV